MASHYEVLGITADAGAEEIKHAYFRCVKKYPPERFPEEFMKIRTAYDVLSNLETRAQYDATSELPELAALLYHNAERAMETDNYQEAIRLYLKLTQMYPDFVIFKAELARAYANNGNTGKSVRIWEELCALEPQNAGFAGEHAHTLAERGWRKKAIAEYWRGLSIDDNDVNLWFGLLECYNDNDEYDEAKKVLNTVIPLSVDRGFENINFYYIGAMLALDHDRQDFLPYLQKVLDMQKTGADIDDEDVCFFLIIILLALQSHEDMDNLALVIKLLENIHFENEMLNAHIVRSRAVVELSELTGYPEIITDILGHTLTAGIAKKQQYYMGKLFIETEIAYNAASLKSSIIRLRTEHPNLYKLDAEFFNEVLSQNNSQKPLEKCQRRARQYKRDYPELFAFDEELDDEPLVKTQPIRTEPKIGRNAPCPCGSGKKYKKCCGAGA